MPKFMVIVPGDEHSEAGELPPQEVLNAMTAYNEELAKAGMILDLNGLRPTSDGAKVRFKDGKATVVDGPFTEAKEIVAGYWLLQARSKDEVIEWVKRAPFKDFTAQGGEVDIEVRQVYELDDLGEGPVIERAKALGEKLGLS
jgi:hypothetical protein